MAFIGIQAGEACLVFPSDPSMAQEFKCLTIENIIFKRYMRPDANFEGTETKDFYSGIVFTKVDGKFNNMVLKFPKDKSQLPVFETFKIGSDILRPVNAILLPQKHLDSNKMTLKFDYLEEIDDIVPKSILKTIKLSESSEDDKGIELKDMKLPEDSPNFFDYSLVESNDENREHFLLDLKKFAKTTEKLSTIAIFKID